MVSRHSAFYSPLISVIAGGFLAEEGLEATYATLQPGQRSRHLLRSGEVEVMQSAVGSSWAPLEAGEENLPVHFAQINQRDGFFLTARETEGAFDWADLEGARFVADHGGQPMLMLRYAARCQGVDWERIDLIDAGDVDSIDRAFRDGEGDFVHQQGPAPQQLEVDGIGKVVASVGAAMPEVAFSSLCAMPAFVGSERGRAFTRAYRKSREWVRTAEPELVARKEKSFFPDVSDEALTTAIEAYQDLGTWDGDIAIPAELYEQALKVFLFGEAIRERHPYDRVVVDPPA